MPEATTPLLREDWDRLRADLSRIEQTLQKSQAEIKADVQEADRRAAQSLAEVQRGVTRVGSRLDEIGGDVGRLDRRVDELRGRVDALALQYDVAGPPLPGGAPPVRPGGPPAPGRAPSLAPPGSAPPPPASGGPPTGAPPSPGPAGQATDLYQTAYIDYTRGNYNLAIAAFTEFLRLHPGSDLAEKAQYWIGECHFSLARDLQRRGDQARAIQAFERAVHSLKGLPHVIDVRNYGLVAGIELDPVAGSPGARAFGVYLKCFEKGLLIRTTGDIIALSPPLIIEPAHIDELISILSDALK